MSRIPQRDEPLTPSLVLLFSGFRRPKLWLSVITVWMFLALLSAGLLSYVESRTGSSAPEMTWTEPWTGIELTLVKSGLYSMGSPPNEADRQDDEILHPVRLTRPIYVGTTEVTQAQWQTVMGSNPGHFQPPEFEPCPQCPVENVNYWQIEEFLDLLSSRAGHSFRLPTEAEWEVACRAGTETAFAFGDRLSLKDANLDDDGESPLEFGRTSAVASYRPNPWGLFDFHGNVWEWTSDPLCPYSADGSGVVSERVDPRPDCESPWRVIRGGSWHFGADSARCSLRYTHRPRDLGPSLGFRVVREISSDPAS